MDPTSFLLLGWSAFLVPVIGWGKDHYVSVALCLIALLFFFKFHIYKKSFEHNLPDSLVNAIIYNAVTKDDRPSSFIIGKWFIGYILDSSEEKGGNSMIIFTRPTVYKELLSGLKPANKKTVSSFKEKTIELEDSDVFKIVHVTGAYDFRRIEMTSSFPIDADPKESQLKIVDSIMRIPKKTQVVMISGDPGTGKSFIADLLIKACLKSPKDSFTGCKQIRYCFEFNPMEPNTFFANVYNKVKPSEECRLIVLLDEVDVMLRKINDNDVVKNQKYPMEVSNKTSWNRFMDCFDRGYYPWVTLIMTSNSSRATLDKLDTSYLREGRVDHWFVL